MRSFTWETVCRRRLARHFLLQPVAQGRLVDAVRAVGGIQAQILSAAELAIGMRVAGVTRQDVQAALWERHVLVKTYGPRGTLHLLPADEVAQRVGAWARERLLSAWGELLAPAAFVGRLCFGPSKGNQVTFVRADQWVDGWREHDPEQALAEVCRRYFATYGPASHQDFAHWFRLKPHEARRVLESLADALEEVNLAGRRAWMLATDTEEEWEPAHDPLRLLPPYDCYVLGCGPREWVVPTAARTRVSTYGRGRFEGATALPVLLIDGVVAGMWEQRKLASRSELRVEAFGQLTPRQRDQLEAEAAHIGAFLEVEVALSLDALG
jgi:hypothetical protein